MNLKGLKVNKPKVEQYQLWIFEFPEQKHPIDGGVFDISGEEAKIQIDPNVSVKKGVQFVVTVEPPGGVVVSDRSRIAAVAVPD